MLSLIKKVNYCQGVLVNGLVNVEGSTNAAEEEKKDKTKCSKKNAQDKQVKPVNNQTSMDYKTHEEDQTKYKTCCHYRKIKMVKEKSKSCSSDPTKSSEYWMKTSASSDSVFRQVRNTDYMGSCSGGVLTKDEVEKRFKAWKRTTLVRKRTKSLEPS